MSVQNAGKKWDSGFSNKINTSKATGKLVYQWELVAEKIKLNG